MAGFGDLITIPNVLLASGALAGIGSIVGAVKGADAAKSSAEVQSNDAAQAAQAQMEMFNRIQNNLAPYQQAGRNALSSLQVLTGTGGGFGTISTSVPAATNALISTSAPVAAASQPRAYTAPAGQAPAMAPTPMSTGGGIEAPQPYTNDPKLGLIGPMGNNGKIKGPNDAPSSGNNFRGFGSLNAALQAGAYPHADAEWQGIAAKAGYGPKNAMSPQAAPRMGGNGDGIDENGNGTENIDDPTGTSRAPQYNALTDAPGHFVPDPNGGLVWQEDKANNNAMEAAGWVTNPLGTAVSKGTDWLTSKLAPNTSQGVKDELGYGTSMLMTGNPLGVIPTVMGGLEAAGYAKGDQNAISYGGQGGGGTGSPMQFAGQAMAGNGTGTMPGGPQNKPGFSGTSQVGPVGTEGGYATGGPQFMSGQGMAPQAGAGNGTGANLLVPGANAASSYSPVNGASNPLDSYLTAPYRPMADFAPTMEQLESTPGYKFTLDQGLKATQNAYAAKGLARSGAALKGAAEYTTGLASQTYQQQFQNYLTQYQQQYQDYQNQNQQIYNMLMGQVSAGQNAAAGAGNFGMNAAQNAGNFNTSGAAATGAGQVGAANALLGGIAGVSNSGNSIVNGLMVNQLLQGQVESNKLIAGMYAKAA